jgi:hypothetical protein
MNTIISMSGVQKSYNYSGPTSVQSNVIARKKAVQRRVSKNVQFFGNSTMKKDSNGGNVDGQQQSGVNGVSSTRTYFAGIFPRMKYY